MKERPILFSSPMVRAILDGTKTQTRRIVKAAPWLSDEVMNIEGTPHWTDGTGWDSCVKCPYGKPGDRIWVRETHLVRGAGAVVDYRADMDPIEASGHGAFYGGWKPSLFMRRENSRITLEVESIRVERLQECSEADAFAEGVGHEMDDAYNAAEHAQLGGCPLQAGTPAQHAYSVLWESINGPGSWDANPWVWVVTFRRIKP